MFHFFLLFLTLFCLSQFQLSTVAALSCLDMDADSSPSPSPPLNQLGDPSLMSPEFPSQALSNWTKGELRQVNWQQFLSAEGCDCPRCDHGMVVKDESLSSLESLWWSCSYQVIVFFHHVTLLSNHLSLCRIATSVLMRRL